jgi:hypothetical protein
MTCSYTLSKLAGRRVVAMRAGVNCIPWQETTLISQDRCFMNNLMNNLQKSLDQAWRAGRFLPRHQKSAANRVILFLANKN